MSAIIPQSARLEDYIRRLDPARVLWTDGKTAITAGGAVALACSSNRRPVAGRRVVLWVSEPLIFAQAVVLLDGSASEVLCLPKDVNRAAARDIVAVFQPELFLTDLSLVSDAKSFGAKTAVWPDLAASGQPAVSELKFTLWVVPTSGTTGVPKLVAHTLSSLTRTAKSDSRVGSRYRWGQFYDMARFAGLQVFLNSLLSGSTLILTQPSDPLGVRFSQLVETGCNALSATPTLWRKILMTPGASRLNLLQITLGGEIVEQTILDALRKHFPDARISHIYASTEAGAAFTVNDGRAGFPQEFLSVPPPGIELRIDPRGFLLVRPQHREQSYLGSPDALFDQEGFLNTGDLVAERDGRICFLGRANGAINVGGNKVQPEEIEAVLHAAPGVAMARVYPQRSSMMGTLVAADVLASQRETDPAVMRRNLIAYCAKHLEEYKIPAVIRFVQDFEVQASGKLARR